MAEMSDEESRAVHNEVGRVEFEALVREVTRAVVEALEERGFDVIRK